jgi:phosphoglucosamine mutase
MEKLFGTDGIRGVAGEYPLDHSSAYALGKTLISLLQAKGLEPKVLIGRDTRESGVWLEEALFAGIREKKGEAISAGVIPTSAISFLTKKYSFSAGIVISASHNPYHDNGLKVFSSEGMKISDEWEEHLEKALRSTGKISGKEKTEIYPHPAFRQDYVNFLESQFSPEKLPRKIKIVLDCANGASFSIAPQVFSDLGLEIITLNNSPNGQNINENCGSLYPQNLSKKVIETQADLGIAFDGDADRAVWVDEKGNILNGDHTLFVLSRFMREKGRQRLGLKLVRTQVGDKYVLEEMIKIKANLGGEQSGHTIFLDDCPTGDGILTSVKWLEAMAESNLPPSKMVEGFEEYPQVLRNVRVRKKIDFKQFPEIVKTIEDIKNQLEASGRMEVRFSGTEPMARIMIEGKDKILVEQYSQEMATVIHKYLGN